MFTWKPWTFRLRMKSLEESLKEQGLMNIPGQIYNVDETGVPLDHEPPMQGSEAGCIRNCMHGYIFTCPTCRFLVCQCYSTCVAITVAIFIKQVAKYSYRKYDAHKNNKVYKVMLLMNSARNVHRLHVLFILIIL